MLQQRIRNHEATLWSYNYNFANAWGPSGPNGLPVQGPVPGGPLGPFNGTFEGPFGPGLNGPSGVFNGLHGPFNPLGGVGSL
jgi:hypothetical protein